MSLIFAPADREVAGEVAHRLEQAAQARVWLEEVSAPVNETWDQGASSAGVIVLLSPDSVPASGGREEWEDLLAYTGPPPLAKLLVRDCRHPKLLERSSFYRWSEPDVLRQLQRWAIALHGDHGWPLPGNSCDCTPEALWAGLVDRPGVMRVDDSAQARQFARDAAAWFRDIIPVACAGRSLPMILGQIAFNMGVKLHGTMDEACEQIAVAFADARVLLLLEGFEGDAPFYLAGEASVLYAPAGEPEPVPSVDEMTYAFLHRVAFGRSCVLSVPFVEQAILSGAPSRLGRAAFAFLRGQDRLFEATHIARLLLEHGDAETQEWAQEELSWLVGGDRVRTPKAPTDQLSFGFA